MQPPKKTKNLFRLKFSTKEVHFALGYHKEKLEEDTVKNRKVDGCENMLQELKNLFNVECDKGQGFIELIYQKCGVIDQDCLKFIFHFLSKLVNALHFTVSDIEEATTKERDILITVSCSGSNYDQICQVLNETVHFLPLPNKEISDQFIEDFLKLAETVKLKPLRQDDNSNLNESPINSNSNSNSEIDFDLIDLCEPSGSGSSEWFAFNEIGGGSSDEESINDSIFEKNF
ncbi:hypothetical protein M9Y10_007553 [Tritrichomonas musculus]|uniref:Initiator binding domain-containing protein n=1 Tax=Tritrichomonas musculus TaxID=1915356 RepID=A0ABR2J3Y2_9EUKA